MKIVMTYADKGIEALESISLKTIQRILIFLIVLWLTLVLMFIHNVTQNEQMVDDLHFAFYGEYRQKFPLNNEMGNNQLTPPFPIDIVYTWAGEIDMNNLNNTYIHQHLDKIKNRQHTILPHLRYNNELKYSLRSIYKYTPWVRKIYVLHNDDAKCPSWINYTKMNEYNQYINYLFEDLRINNYSEYLYQFQNIKLKQRIIGFECLKASSIFNNKAIGAKTHSSQSFELRLHHIKGLADHYVYFNDDFFIFREISYLFFFNNKGVARYPMQYWERYKNATVEKVYDKTAVQRLQIKYDIPYKIKGYRMFFEHMPKPYAKSDWISLEKRYSEWFNFTEEVHIEGNYCPLMNRIGCFHNNPNNILLAYRKLILNDTQTNSTGIWKGLIDAHNHLGFEWLKQFKFEPYNYSMPVSYVHIWVSGGKRRFNNTDKMEALIYRIEKRHPITFNMNDVWHDNLEVYNMQLECLLKFFEKHFPYDGYI